MGLGIALIVGSTRLPDSGTLALSIKGVLIALGAGTIGTTSIQILKSFYEAIWPETEERAICAEIWNRGRRKQLITALSENSPAEALRIVYANDDRLEEFDHNSIFREIRNMHEGAFLAALHLWGEGAYNEAVMDAELDDLRSELQILVAQYRQSVADNIKSNHNIAARRYRVRAANARDFVNNGVAEKRADRLKSLAELSLNVASDLNQGWAVDVEFFSKTDRHNPFLDYALLFGAQPTGRTEPQPEPRRIAFITNPPRRLMEDQDYTGVVIRDPELVTLLMEERFRTELGCKDGHKFLLDILPLLKTERDRINSTNGNPNSADPNNLMEHVARIIEQLEVGLRRRSTDQSKHIGLEPPSIPPPSSGLIAVDHGQPPNDPRLSVPFERFPSENLLETGTQRPAAPVLLSSTPAVSNDDLPLVDSQSSGSSPIVPKNSTTSDDTE